MRRYLDLDPAQIEEVRLLALRWLELNRAQVATLARKAHIREKTLYAFLDNTRPSKNVAVSLVVEVPGIGRRVEWHPEHGVQIMPVR